MADPAVWDVVIVGSGPAGCAAAIGALCTRPNARVLLLDRADFPRDKVCGDAVLGAGFRELEAVGVPTAGLRAGYAGDNRLRLVTARGVRVRGSLSDDLTVIPRAIFDARLQALARSVGVVWRRHLVRSVRDGAEYVELDGRLRARIAIGADGAESIVRRAVCGAAHRDVAIAIRGYDSSGTTDRLELVFDERPGLSYAWRFPITGGLANVGYGHQVAPGERASRTALEARLRKLLPGVAPQPPSLRAHRLPLSSTRQRVAKGRLLLVGDAASLVNPLSGEGIYYAIVSGLLAGSAAVNPQEAADAYRARLHRRLGRHLNHVSALAALTRSRRFLEAGILAAADDRAVFGDLAAVGLGDGRITPRLAIGLVRRLIADRAALGFLPTPAG